MKDRVVARWLRQDGGMRWMFACLFVLVGLMCPTRLSAAAIAEVPFEFRDGLLWLKVTSERSPKPLTFLLDSGATVSVLDLGTAERLKVKPASRVKVQGVHANMAGYWPARLEATLEGIVLPKRYLVTDLSALSKVCHASIDGLLGADFFSEHVVEIDFSGSRIRLLGRAETNLGTEVLPLRCRNGRMQVPVRVNDSRPEWVRVDTGCTSSLQWVFKKVVAPSIRAIRSVGLSRCSFPTTRADVRLNEIVFEHVITGVHSKAIFPGEHGLLGTELLSRFQRITFDPQGGRLLLD